METSSHIKEGIKKDIINDLHLVEKQRCSVLVGVGKKPHLLVKNNLLRLLSCSFPLKLTLKEKELAFATWLSATSLRPVKDPKTSTRQETNACLNFANSIQRFQSYCIFLY